MNLAQLQQVVAGSHLEGDGDVQVAGIQHDSRSVRPGDMFACLIGQRVDGHLFAQDAIQRGAAALLVQAERRSAVPREVPWLVVEDTRKALAEAAAAIYGYPSRALRLAGVTGTNGKSTTVAMIEAQCRAAGIPAGRCGTLGAYANGVPLPATHTTPQADDLQRLLSAMRDSGVQIVALEVSSHGLALRRSDCTAFEVAVFTNLTQDHLDFHGTMEAYFRAKLRLFTEYAAWSPPGFTAVVNVDDPYGLRIAEAARGRVITFGIERPAQVSAYDIRVAASRTEFVAKVLGQRMKIELPVGGAFQVANALGAIGAAVALGLPETAIVEGLYQLEPVPGRFEAVPTGRPFDVIVDFAHTPDGLKSLLASARKLNPSRLILLFGCGGNRDRTKRPIMGRIAAEAADVVVVTSDNPRHEDPQAIIQDILEGIENGRAKVLVEPDRRTATLLALKTAEPGDLVLLAGKGGETEMIIGDERIPYDDRLVVRELLESLE